MNNPATSDDRVSRFELRTLLETSRLLIESRDSDFVLNNLLLITMGKLLVSRAAILLHNPPDNTYSLAKIKGRSVVQEQEKINLNINPELKKSIWLDTECDGVTMPPLFNSSNAGYLFNLRTSNRHIGYLYLGTKGNQQPLQSAEIEFVEGLCIISSVALANSRMFTELKETNRKLDRRIYELNTLFDLSKEFNLMADREEIARIFKFALLGQMLIRTFVLIYKIDGENEVLASSGLKETPDKDELEAMFNFERDVVLVKSEERENIPFLEKNGLFALISVHFQGQKIAVIGVGERASREGYAETDFNYLRSLANLAVLSIQKTFLLEERIEKERLEEEVNIARTIQRRLLPNPIPEIEGIDLAAVNISSSQVGGDYFDIIKTPDGNHIMAIGDVTGKGIPASLLMANLQSMLHVLLPVDITLSDATGRINELIYENTPSDKFITFFWAKYFHQGNKLRYINAGHNPPYLLKTGSDKITTLQEGGLILGAMPTIVDYQETDVVLETGDIVICFTDGITEAFNEELNEEYEEERLQNCILKNRDKTASEIMNAIINDAQSFTAGKQTDDITLILFKVH